MILCKTIFFFFVIPTNVFKILKLVSTNSEYVIISTILTVITFLKFFFQILGLFIVIIDFEFFKS